jgi:hypothetical protein
VTDAFVLGGVPNPHLEIVGQMIVIGVGMGVTTAPATKTLMGVVSKEKAGSGSAVNDATRELGATLGIAVIGSICASLYASGVEAAPLSLPRSAVHGASESIGAALAVSHQLGTAGNSLLDAARAAFFHGFQVGCLVAAGVLFIGAAFVARFLPARPAPPLDLANLERDFELIETLPSEGDDHDRSTDAA